MMTCDPAATVPDEPTYTPILAGTRNLHLSMTTAVGPWNESTVDWNGFVDEKVVATGDTEHGSNRRNRVNRLWCTTTVVGIHTSDVSKE
jgi:hypothetical protein